MIITKFTNNKTILCCKVYSQICDFMDTIYKTFILLYLK